MSDMEQQARHLANMTVGDLQASLKFKQSLDVLRRALELAKSGSGYGSGKTATKLIEAAIKRAEKAMRVE